MAYDVFTVPAYPQCFVFNLITYLTFLLQKVAGGGLHASKPTLPAQRWSSSSCFVKVEHIGCYLDTLHEGKKKKTSVMIKLLCRPGL